MSRLSDYAVLQVLSLSGLYHSLSMKQSVPVAGKLYLCCSLADSVW